MDVLALPTTWFWLLFLQPPPTYLPDLTFVISPIKKTVTYTHHTPQHTQHTHTHTPHTVYGPHWLKLPTNVVSSVPFCIDSQAAR